MYENIRNIVPLLRGLNYWTFKQRIKDSLRNVSTIQLLYRIDVYKATELKREEFLRIKNTDEQIAFLKTNCELHRTTKVRKAHSFVLNFLCALEVAIAGPYDDVSDGVTLTDTSNTPFVCTYVYLWSNSTFYSVFGAEAVTGDTSYGIVAGIGTTAPTNTDYCIETIILDGDTSGKFLYQSCSVGAANVVGTNVDMFISRCVVNNSGGTITIREIGQINKGIAKYVMITHDAVNQDVDNGEIAVLQYIWRTTV